MEKEKRKNDTNYAHLVYLIGSPVGDVRRLAKHIAQKNQTTIHFEREYGSTPEKMKEQISKIRPLFEHILITGFPRTIEEAIEGGSLGLFDLTLSVFIGLGNAMVTVISRYADSEQIGTATDILDLSSVVETFIKVHTMRLREGDSPVLVRHSGKARIDHVPSQNNSTVSFR